jgi:hypothetical protein
MARNTPLYFGVNGIAERLQKVYLGDSNNVSREVKKIYEGDTNGIARLKYHLHEFIDGSDGFKTCQICGETEAIPTPDHTHSYSSIVVEPTCTERGYTKYTCNCGETYKDNYVNALGHTEVIDEAVEATCTTDGLTEGRHCSRCDEVIIEQKVITALGHDFADGICTTCGAIDPNCKHSDTTTSETITKQPTCTKQGSKTITVTCNICNIVVSKTTENIPMLAHTEETISGKAATCTETGLTEGKKCSVCGKILVEQTIIPKLAHTEKVIKGKAATCTATGLTDGKKCSVCNEILVEQVVIPKLAHTEEEIPGKAATCTTAGLTSGKKCAVCGNILVKQTEIPAGHIDENADNICDVCGESLCEEHDVVIDQAVAPTCTASGLTEGSHCRACGKILVAQKEVKADLTDPDVHALVHLGTYCSGDHISSGKNLYECTRDGCRYSIVLDDGLLGDTIHTSQVEHKEVPATCTANGFTAGITCNNCGADNRRLIPMLEHTEKVVAGYAATCAQTGKTDGVECSVCGTVITAQTTIPINPNNHNLKPGITVDPTCTTYGYTPYNCTRCDYSVEGDIIAELGHNEVIVEGHAATCSATGLTDGKKCSVCGATTKEQETISIIPNAHDHVAGIPVDATCTEDSYVPFRCKYCGDTYNQSNYGTALGHNEGEPAEENRKEPTCTKVGSVDMVTRCTRCSTVLKRETVELNALGHDYKVTNTVASTCTENGYTEYKCKRCGDTKKEVIFELADHKEGTPTEVSRTEPTCTTAGSSKLETRCTECGTLLDSETVELKALGHDHVAGIPVEPTCTDDGYVPFRCRCGDTYNQINYGSALGHDDGTTTEVDRTEPTCTNAGSSKLETRCTRCGTLLDSETVKLDALGHDTVSVTVPSTCTEGGYTQITCKRCDYSARQEIFELADHKEGEPVEENRKEPTCTAAGSYDLVTRCTECNTVLDRDTITLPATGHSFIAIKTVPATCTEPGYTNYKCKCGETKTETLFELADHQYKAKTTAPTCTARGYTTHTCSVCGDYYIDSYVNAKGHTEVAIPAVAATCKDTGLTEGKKCSVCGTITQAQTTIPVDPDNHSYVGDYCSICGGKKTGGSVGGCVFAGTQIALDADTSIDIADFVGGTPIDFCNPSTLEHTPQQTLTRFVYDKSTDKVVLTLEDDKTLALTPNHVVLTEEGFKAYLDNYDYPKYKVGDKLATVDGYKELVSIQEEVIPETTVYNIATENSLMVANGIIVAGELNYNIETLAFGGDTSKEEF